MTLAQQSWAPSGETLSLPRRTSPGDAAAAREATGPGASSLLGDGPQQNIAGLPILDAGPLSGVHRPQAPGG